jgi:hypothetical protein
MHHNGRLLPVATSINLLLHILAVLEVLVEVADVAADLLVGLEREWDNGDEAKGKPVPTRC